MILITITFANTAVHCFFTLCDECSLINHLAFCRYFGIIAITVFGVNGYITYSNIPCEPCLKDYRNKETYYKSKEFCEGCIPNYNNFGMLTNTDTIYKQDHNISDITIIYIIIIIIIQGISRANRQTSRMCSRGHFLSRYR